MWDGRGMARQLRVEFPGAIYHVTCRVIGDGRLERSRLFTEDKERERFVERLGEGLRRTTSASICLS